MGDNEDNPKRTYRYFSDGYITYTQLMYPGQHAVAMGKSQTYSVEGDNAELRHYLAWLGRRSRRRQHSQGNQILPKSDLKFPSQQTNGPGFHLGSQRAASVMPRFAGYCPG